MKSSLLKAERKRRNWSQAEVARAVGVSVKTVSRWEQGQAVPHPYYRNKLLILFGKTAEELGLFVDEDEALQNVTLFLAQSTMPDIQAQTSLSANPATPPKKMSGKHANQDEIAALNMQLDALNTSMSASLLAHSRISQNLGTQHLRGHSRTFIQTHRPEFHFPEDALWNHMGIISTFRPFTHFPSRPMSLKIFLFLTIIITVLLSFILHPLLTRTYTATPLPMSTITAAIDSPPSYGLMVQNTDTPLLENAAQNLNQAFSAVYPQLVNRFALNPANIPKNVALIFSSQLSSSAVTNGTTININASWIQQHPTDTGLLTHELTLIVERYPTSAPTWFASGLADYTRSVYGPADDDWFLPDKVQLQDSYLQGGPVAARFLLWLEQHTILDIVDQLNHALQKGQAFSAIFDQLTHHTVDELWSQYQLHPDITQTPKQLYITVTSRKPIYRISSLNLQVSQPRSWQLFVIPGLFVSNFAIQADITIVRGDGAGFIFRWQTTANDPQYRMRIFPMPDSTYGDFNLVDPGNLLAFGSNSAIRQGYNQTNQLTIIAQSHTIYIYINGQFISKVDSNLSSDGIVTAMANEDYNPAEVWFKNIQVF